MLMNSVKRQPNITLEQLAGLVRQYEDLTPEDFRGNIPDDVLEQLKEAGRKPEEVALWNEIEQAQLDTLEDVAALRRKIEKYMGAYPQGPKVAEARNKINSLSIEEDRIRKEIRDREAAERERRDWEMLERGNYSKLQSYKMKYPASVHLSELDDLMWMNTKAVMSSHSLQRYLSDWPVGNHSAEAQDALNGMAEWEEVKRSGDIFRVDDYRDNHPDGPFANEVNALYYKLRDDELEKMKENPSEYSKDDVERLIAADIFTRWQLEDEGLITDESWETLQLDRELFPNIQDYMIEDPNITAPAGCTDIYLFGTPGTGKTCLLMGLTGANGEGYTLNMKTQGGAYAAALQEFANAGITPGSTFGKFVTVINGDVYETDRRGNYINHHINLVEMSGEEFALRIADNREPSLANMGTGATNLLSNDNRKVFFIVVDSTKDKVKVEYIEQVKDAEGNVIDERVRKKYISQLIILQKFISLFALPENQEIMKKVDAIHFVVTKADMLGDGMQRKERARDLLLTTYKAPVEQLKNFCRQTKRINVSTDYRPQVFTFSLGQFYLGDVFNFDKSESVQIIDTIRTVTYAVKEKSWWDKFRDAIG